MPEVLSVANQHLPLSQAVVDFKVGLFRTRGRLGRALQAGGSYALPGDTTALRQPVRSGVYQGLTPGGGGGGGGLGRRIGGASRRFRCPPGFEHGGRFANRTLSNCGSRLFDIPGGSSRGGVGSVTGSAVGAAARRAIRGVGADPGTSNDLNLPNPNLRSPVIQRAASIPEVGPLNRRAQSSAIDDLVSNPQSLRSSRKRLVRRDGVSLVPVASTERLSVIRRNPDMQDAFLVVNPTNGDIEQSDLDLLFSGNIRGLTFALGNGSQISLSTTGKLSPSERNAIMDFIDGSDAIKPEALSEAAGKIEKLSFSGKFPGISRPHDRITVESGDKVRQVQRWVYELFLAPSAPNRGKREPWGIVKRGKVYDLPLSEIPASERQTALEFKIAVHETRTAFSAASIQYKRVAAVWDADLPPKGGFRCPPGTRYGGRITDRFGRNCGWGVTRRLANSLEGTGRNIGERLDARRDRRAASRMRRGAARAERQVERQARRAPRPQSPRNRVGQRPRRDRVANRLDNFANRMDGGRGRPGPTNLEPRKPKRRQRAADRLDNWADEQIGPKKPKRRRRGAMADRLDNFADDVLEPKKPKDKKPRRDRRGNVADRLDRFAERMDNPPSRRSRSNGEPDSRKDFMDQHDWDDRNVGDLNDDELDGRINDLVTERNANRGNEDPYTGVREDVLREYRNERNARRKADRARLKAEAARQAEQQRREQENIVPEPVDEEPNVTDVNFRRDPRYREFDPADVHDMARDLWAEEGNRGRPPREFVNRVEREARRRHDAAEKARIERLRRNDAELNKLLDEEEVIPAPVELPDVAARRVRHNADFINNFNNEILLQRLKEDLVRSRNLHSREAENVNLDDARRQRARQLVDLENEFIDKVDARLAERAAMTPGERFKEQVERDLETYRNMRENRFNRAKGNEIDLNFHLDDIDREIRHEEMRKEAANPERAAKAEARHAWLVEHRAAVNAEIDRVREIKKQRDGAFGNVKKIHDKKLEDIQGDPQALEAFIRDVEAEKSRDRRGIAPGGDEIDKAILNGRVAAHDEAILAARNRIQVMERERVQNERRAQREAQGLPPEDDRVANRPDDMKELMGSPRDVAPERGLIAEPDLIPAPKEIVNPKINSEQKAIDHIKNGGSLDEVPNEFWLKAVAANSSDKGTDRNSKYREIAPNGGAIGATRIFVLRNEDGKAGDQGWVFKAAADPADNAGELFGFAVANAHGIYVDGPGADGVHSGAGDNGLGNDMRWTGQYIVIPFAANGLPDGVEHAGGGNYRAELLQGDDVDPGQAAQAILTHALHDFMIGVSDRHTGNGMLYKGPDGKIYAVPIDQGWAGKWADMDVTSYLGRHMYGEGLGYIKDKAWRLKRQNADEFANYREQVVKRIDDFIAQARVVAAQDRAETIRKLMVGVRAEERRDVEQRLGFLVDVYARQLDKLINERDNLIGALNL